MASSITAKARTAGTRKRGGRLTGFFALDLPRYASGHAYLHYNEVANHRNGGIGKWLGSPLHPVPAMTKESTPQISEDGLYHATAIKI